MRGTDAGLMSVCLCSQENISDSVSCQGRGEAGEPASCGRKSGSCRRLSTPASRCQNGWVCPAWPSSWLPLAGSSVDL